MKCLSAASRTKCRKLDDYPTPAKAIAVKLSVLTHLHTHAYIYNACFGKQTENRISVRLRMRQNVRLNTFWEFCFVLCQRKCEATIVLSLHNWKTELKIEIRKAETEIHLEGIWLGSLEVAGDRFKFKKELQIIKLGQLRRFKIYTN